MVDLNATKAYQRCGYGTNHYYGDSVAAAKLLNKPEVIQLIHEAENERSKRTEITQDMVVRELSLIAFSNLKKLAKWDIDGITLKGSEELTMDECVCINEISQKLDNYGSQLKIKLYDKKSALIDLGKHIGMFWEDNSKTKDPTEEANKIRAAQREIERIMGGGPDADSNAS